jgi:uncharacterized protein YaiL (DUF2058 family)
MNSHSFTLAERLIPATYLQQAAAAKKTRESLIRQLIEQVGLTLSDIEIQYYIKDKMIFDKV